jgi:hypothetical protein
VTKFRDLPAAKFGRYGEQIVGRLLRKAGAGVIATFKFSGENDNEAPALEFDDRRTVLADFDVSLKGRTFSVEAKTYKGAAMNSVHKCLVHGIPVRLFDEYCATEKARGIPVYLGVLEVDTGAFLVSNEPVSAITPRWTCQCSTCVEGRGATCEFKLRWGNSYPQYYFRRDSFTEWNQLDGVELKKLQDAHGKISHALRKHVANEPAVKPAVAEKSPWTWTCLPCNVVGTGDKAKHRCTDVQDWRVAYWTRRLRFALRTSTAEQVSEIVAKPIERIQLVEWLGPSWAPSGDIA